jgi:peptide deformylase
MVLDIVTYGNDVLRRPAKPVEAVDDGLRALARDMLETMYDAEGVGLAAEQVGREEAICVIDVKPEYEKAADVAEFNRAIAMPLVMVNPRIVASEGTQRGTEGCLSFPGVSAQVTRALSVRVDWLGEDGKHYSARVHGLLARAVQHEVDHLHGTVFVDRLSPTQRMLVAGKLRKLRREAQ